jgi:hypothetical protein
MRGVLLFVAILPVFGACDGSPASVPPPSDAGEASALDAQADDSPIISITLDPLGITPTFSPAITDYYTRCMAEENAATLAVTYADGSMQTTALDLVENQELVVGGQYYIRCVPPNFPNIVVTTHSEGTPTPGYYILQSNEYAVVLDTHGTPIWYAGGTGVINADAQEPNLISFMPNSTLGSIGTSLLPYFELRNIATATTTTVKAVGSPTDEHELRLLSNGDYLLQSFIIEYGVDLTGLGTYGSNESMADCEIQEVDGNGKLVWSWLASDHIDPVKESLEPANFTLNSQTIVDVFHCNAIDVDVTGNLLYSLRHANALYYIDRSSGSVLWKLGGTTYNKDGADYITVTNDTEITFSMQHDARFLPNGDISMFDDHGAPSAVGTARGVEYALDMDAETASVVWQYLGPLQSMFEGSCRREADGHTVIGWGGMSPDPRSMTEVDEDGNDVLDIALSLGVSVSYRAIKVPLSQLDINIMRATAGQ